MTKLPDETLRRRLEGFASLKWKLDHLRPEERAQLTRMLDRLVGLAKSFSREAREDKRQYEAAGPGSFHFGQFLKSRSIRWSFMLAARTARDAFLDEAMSQRSRRMEAATNRKIRAIQRGYERRAAYAKEISRP